jgi:glycosyltransferase involved in cell wall biosynthesis
VGIDDPDPRTGRAHGLVMVCDVDLDTPDGACTHTIEVARGFARTGLHVDLIARGGDPHLPGVDYTCAQGGEQERLRRLLSINTSTIAALWRRRRHARRLYARHKWTTLPATVAGRLLGYSVVSEVDDVPYGRGYQGPIHVHVDLFKRMTTTLMGWLSDGVVAGTEEVRTLLAGQFRVPRKRISVIPIGVDVDYFAGLDRDASLRRTSLDPSHRHVLFVGQFAPWVDFDVLLDAFATVIRAAPDARLVLVGDGELRPQVEELVRALGIEHAVTLTGFVRDRETVRDLLASAVVVVASHRAEHLDRIGMNATKIAEYLACGRAVVAKDVARLREMIEEPGAGHVARDSAEMAAAIISLLDPAHADSVGSVGRELASRRHSWDSAIRQTLPMFTSACSRD